MSIAAFSTKPYDKEFINWANEKFNFHITYFEASLSSHTADLAKDHDVVCVFVNDQLDRGTIARLSALSVKLIALRCAGYNNVDVAAAHEHGLRVVRVPAYSPEAVAEHALALILTLNRKTHKAYNRIREGNFSLDRLIGFNLQGKVVGVIGTGQIGASFCRMMKGLGCTVIAHDVVESDLLKKEGISYKSLSDVFCHSDIISLHCPLTSQTHHIINEQSLLLMKDGVMIINTSRGGLIHTAEIIKALKSKKIGFLGIDVYEQEENLFFNDFSDRIIEDDMILRLISFPNVLITSHQAFLTREALEQIATTTLNNVKAFYKNETVANEIL